MNLEHVDKVIAELAEGLAGRRMHVPSNAEIRDVLGFIGQHLRDKGEVYSGLSERLAAGYVRVDPQLLADLQTLRERLRDAMRCDAQLSRRVPHVPNRIPARDRLANGFFAACLFAYASLATKIDDFFIPGKRSNGVHLHGASVWVMFAATVCAVIVLLVVVVDHYDTRPNERVYEQVGKLFRVVGWCLFAAAFVVDLTFKTRH